MIFSVVLKYLFYFYSFIMLIFSVIKKHSNASLIEIEKIKIFVLNYLVCPAIILSLSNSVSIFNYLKKKIFDYKIFRH